MRRPAKRGRILSEINITPFTDVVLVLLIIFMVTTPLMLQQGIKVKLPSAKTSQTDIDQGICVTINREGALFLNNKTVGFDALKTEISLRLMNKTDQPVIVKADRDVRYDAVVKVLDIARQSGAKGFALSVESQDASPR